MAYNLKYKATNPRTIHGAATRNWKVIDVPYGKILNEHDSSWLGLEIWTDRNAKGYYLSDFFQQKFAFEDAMDAMIFEFKWL